MTSGMKLYSKGALVLVVAMGIGARTARVETQEPTGTDSGPFTVIDFPGAANSSPHDINSDGVIVGRYSIAGRTHGYVRSAAGDFTAIDVPGAVFSAALSINNRGDIVGQFALPAAPSERHGFLLKDGEFTYFDPPGSRFTNALSINERGDIAGRYCTLAQCTLSGTGAFHGYVLRDGEFTFIDVPGARETDAFGVNARGAIAGGFLTVQNQEQLFVLDNGVFTTVALPEGQQLSLDKGGINERGDFVGAYCVGPAACQITLTGAHGLVMREGTFTTLDIPGARSTAATGINARGEIVGTYSDGVHFHGFLISAGRNRND